MDEAEAAKFKDDTRDSVQRLIQRTRALLFLRGKNGRACLMGVFTARGRPIKLLFYYIRND